MVYHNCLRTFAIVLILGIGIGIGSQLPFARSSHCQRWGSSQAKATAFLENGRRERGEGVERIR